MSIAEREAETAYPSEYTDDQRLNEKLITVDHRDLQEAYRRGRCADLTHEEVEAVAKCLCYYNSPVSENTAEDIWREADAYTQRFYLNEAQMCLAFAREAVSR